MSAIDLLDQFRQILAEVPMRGPLLLAYSGGLDSTVLLHLLAGNADARARGWRAIHIDHGLSTQSADWAEFCQRQCERLGVPLRVVRVNVPASRLGLEGEARKQRYQALREAMAADELLLTAHHGDDQVETFLLRALRASGGSALLGIRALQPFAPGWLWRPLLGITRAQLAAYAEQHRLSWLDDPMNQREDLDRGYLRAQVLPALRARWPSLARNIARSRELLAHAADAEASLARIDLARCQAADPAVLNIPALAALSEGRAAQVLRSWVEANQMPPINARSIDECLRQLRVSATESLHLNWADVTLRRYRDLLYLEFAAATELQWPSHWDGHTPLSLCPRLALTASMPFPAPIEVRRRTGGERILLHRQARRQELRDLLQRYGVPPWQRGQLPLLCEAGGELLAVGDLFVAARFHELCPGLRLRLVRHDVSLSA